MQFRWDAEKEAANRKKHGISFELARQLFTSGQDYLEIFDANHSVDEDRFIAVGLVQERVIVVVFTEPEDGVYRFLSARLGKKHEITRFFESMRGDS